MNGPLKWFTIFFTRIIYIFMCLWLSGWAARGLFVYPSAFCRRAGVTRTASSPGALPRVSLARSQVPVLKTLREVRAGVPRRLRVANGHGFAASPQGPLQLPPSGLAPSQPEVGRVRVQGGCQRIRRSQPVIRPTHWFQSSPRAATVEQWGLSRQAENEVGPGLHARGPEPGTAAGGFQSGAGRQHQHASSGSPHSRWECCWTWVHLQILWPVVCRHWPLQPGLFQVRLQIPTTINFYGALSALSFRYQFIITTHKKYESSQVNEMKK